MTTIEEKLRTPPAVALGVEPAFDELEWSWFLQSSPSFRAGGNASVDAAVGAEVAYAAEPCDVVRAGAAARYGYGPDGANPSGEQWASGCLAIPPLGPFEIGHHFEWDARPALSSQPYLPDELLRRERIRGRLGLLDLELAEPGAHFGIGHVEFSIGLIWSPNRTDHFIEMNVDFAMLRFAQHRRREGREDFVLEILGGGITEFGQSESVSTAETKGVRAGAMRIEAARVDGLVLGPVTLGGSVGYGEGYARRFQTLRYTLPEDQPPDQMLAQIQTVVGGIAARVTAGCASLGIEATRDVYPTSQNDVALDTRVRLSAQGIWGDMSGVAGVFYANTLLAGASGADREDTGGGDLHLTYLLGPDVSVGLLGEAARSFYAGGTASDAIDPRWAYRGFLALTLWGISLRSEAER